MHNVLTEKVNQIFLIINDDKRLQTSDIYPAYLTQSKILQRAQSLHLMLLLIFEFIVSVRFFTFLHV